jgi:hypothetical protein
MNGHEAINLTTEVNAVCKTDYMSTLKHHKCPTRSDKMPERAQCCSKRKPRNLILKKPSNFRQVVGLNCQCYHYSAAGNTQYYCCAKNGRKTIGCCHGGNLLLFFFAILTLICFRLPLRK